MATADYVQEIRAMDWPDLLRLWAAIEARDTPGWPSGYAFQYLIIRAFELTGAQVTWPYQVKLHGSIVEEIDGAVVLNGLYCLIEAKDYADESPASIAPIAKLRSQLLRRPAATIGILFSRSGFTDPAIELCHYCFPQTIILWSGPELRISMERRSLAQDLSLKYRVCVESGVPFWDIGSVEAP